MNGERQPAMAFLRCIINCHKNTGKVNKIYVWTDKTVTVDSADGIAVVYLDGEQAGLHIDHRKYGMFGIRIGEAVVEVENTINYDYEGSFTVLNDEGVGMSTALYYYNEKNNDCLVVICNDNSQRVVALTYYKDYKAATNQLTPVG